MVLVAKGFVGNFVHLSQNWDPCLWSQKSKGKGNVYVAPKVTFFLYPILAIVGFALGSVVFIAFRWLFLSVVLAIS